MRIQRILAVAIVALVLSLLGVHGAGADEPTTTSEGKQEPAGAETAKVRDLAARITQQDPQAADGPNAERIRREVTALSVGEAAALGMLLLEGNKVDPVPWVKLAAQREAHARERLEQLLARFDLSRPEYPHIETTVRGPMPLREVCGDELLAEVTGVGFWKFYDEGIPAETDFSDSDIDVLLDLPGLERIWAQGSKLTDAGVERLAMLPRLAEYHFAGCRLTDSSLRAIARPGLRLVDVSGANLVTDEGVALLGDCPHLVELNLEKTAVTSASLVTLAGLQELRALILNDTAVRDGLDQLRSLTRLQQLGLARLGDDANTLPAGCLDFLSDLKNLTSLDLEETAVPSVELRQLPQLAKLSLGQRTLRRIVLVDLPQIESLEVTYPWSPSRDDIRLESVTLERLPGLDRLTLCGLGPDACDGLAQGLATSQDLRCVYLPNAQITDSLAAAIGQLPQLELLGLEESPVSDVHLRSILQAPRLQHLRCGGELLTADGILAFAKRDRLQELTLSGLRLDDLSGIGEARSLRVLRLRRCQIGMLNLTDRSMLVHLEATLGRIDHLRVDDCPKLDHLSLSGVAIGKLDVQSCDQFMEMFAGSDTKLRRAAFDNLLNLRRITIQERASVEELRLTGTPALASVTFWAAEITRQPLEALVDLPALVGLDVSGTRLGDDAATIIARMSGLEFLSASSHFSRQGLEQLVPLAHLQQLQLFRRSDADWTKEEARRMFSRIPDFVVFDQGE